LFVDEGNYVETGNDIPLLFNRRMLLDTGIYKISPKTYILTLPVGEYEFNFISVPRVVVLLTSPAVFEIKFEIPSFRHISIPIIIKKKFNFSTSKQFKYDIQNAVPHYYQVTLEMSNSQLIVLTFTAQSLDQVCSQVRKSYKNVKIIKILKFKKPVSKNNKIDPSAHINVTPTLKKCVGCCDLL
jgi:hypothetical protein